MTTEIPTHGEFMTKAQVAALLASDLIDELSFTDGYMMNIHAGENAALAEEVLRIALDLHAKTFFGTAEDDDLDTLAKDHFGLDRNPGVSSVGIERFERANTLAGNVSIPAGSIIETPDGLQFVTTNAPLMTGLQIDANIAAAVPGVAGIVGPATITIINAASALSDPSVTASNPEKTSGGADKETNEAFRSRILYHFITLRRGTKEALEIGAKMVPGVVNATLDESAYPPAIYIADVTGSANAALVNATALEIVNWRSAGIAVNIFGATLTTQAWDVTLTFAAGSDTSAVREQVEAAIIAALALLKIGETLYLSSIISAAKSVAGVLDCVINDPVGDVVPTASQLLRSGLGTFS